MKLKILLLLLAATPAASFTDPGGKAFLGGQSFSYPALSVAATTVFIDGRLDTNAATSCETQLPFCTRRHPRRTLWTLPCAGAKRVACTSAGSGSRRGGGACRRG